MSGTYGEARCECCDLPVESCGKAAEQRARRDDAAVLTTAFAAPHVVAAQYPGRCADCGEWFPADTPIYAGEGGWTNPVCCPPVTL